MTPLGPTLPAPSGRHLRAFPEAEKDNPSPNQAIPFPPSRCCDEQGGRLFRSARPGGSAAYRVRSVRNRSQGLTGFGTPPISRDAHRQHSDIVALRQPAVERFKFALNSLDQCHRGTPSKALQKLM